MSLFAELKRRNVFKVGIAYAIVAWLLIQIGDVLFPTFQAPDWAMRVFILFVILGFPLAVLLAWAYELTPSGIRRDEGIQGEVTTQTTGQKFNYILSGLFFGAVVGSVIVWMLKEDEDLIWAQDEAVPQIEESITAGDWEAAFDLATEVEKRLPGQPALLEDLWPQMSWLTDIPSDPSGATVYRRPYNGNEQDWQVLGVTPLDNIRIPFGLSRIRIELEGYIPLESTLGGSGNGTTIKKLRLFDRIEEGVKGSYPRIFTLDTSETLPIDMVRVPGWSTNINGEPVTFTDFYLGRYEVTNREYQEFVNAGGYERRSFWEHTFNLDGEEITWEEAMERFKDTTGRPGPSTWIAGTYPDGRENYPVSGVSWYEAAAYARFVGKELPTVHHWVWANQQYNLAWMLTSSNLDGDGPAPVGEYDAISWTGAYDMAGNVREWTFNAVDEEHFILGGGWNDPFYIANNSFYNQPPFDRSATNGFRLARTQDPTTVMVQARSSLTKPVVPDFRSIKPVSDEGYEAYKSLFSYDNQAPLNSRIENTRDTRHWIRQQVSFNAAYGDERMDMYLYLPRTGVAPYQTVIYAPGSGGFNITSFDEYSVHLDFIMKSGRAVVFPVYNGMFERGGKGYPWGNRNAIHALNIENVKDLRRSIDYLTTRPDIDMGSLGYFGFSYGGLLAPYILTMEPRLKTGVLYVAGFSSEPLPADKNFMLQVHYLPRVDVPVLMLNGEYDNTFPLKTNAKPFFEWLGTPDSDKKMIVAPGGHFVPKEILIRETLDWLDKYLGRPRLDS